MRDALVLHWVYSQVGDLSSLQSFMRSHVFAVWDFMSLLKTLQHRLTCMDLPWVPPEDPVSARLINEINLAEESECNSTGVPGGKSLTINSDAIWYLHALFETWW